MISDAFVIVTCDKCEAEEQVRLTALAHPGSYDMRNVRGRLRVLGWIYDEGSDDATCPDCKEKAK